MAGHRRPRPETSSALRPWSVALAAMAALSRGDAGRGLAELVEIAGFSKAPAVTFVIKKVQRPRPPAHELPPRFRDVPYADDEPTVLLPVDAIPLRALA